MSVCIAAACQEEGEPRIVLCSDSRLYYSDLGSRSATVRCDVLGHGWMVQKAGNWTGVRSFSKILENRIEKLPAVKFSDVATECRKATKEFLNAPLYDAKDDYQLLVSGFDGQIPCILEAAIFRGKPKIDSKNFFGAIGWGASVALTLLTQREHRPEMPLSYAAYLAYEAKRASEITAHVARTTTLVIQSPRTSALGIGAYIKIMNQVGEAHLAAIYRRVWKAPFVEIPKLTPDFFLDLQGPESPP